MTGPSTLEQLTLARFIETGAYDRHLRALRRRYRARRDRVVAAVARQLPGFKLSGAAAGLHLILSLPTGLTGADVTAAAKARGVRVMDLRRCRVDGQPPTSKHEADGADRDWSYEALVLGYGNLDDTAVEAAVAGLADAIRASGREAARAPRHDRQVQSTVPEIPLSLPPNTKVPEGTRLRR